MQQGEGERGKRVGSGMQRQVRKEATSAHTGSAVDIKAGANRTARSSIAVVAFCAMATCLHHDVNNTLNLMQTDAQVLAYDELARLTWRQTMHAQFFIPPLRQNNVQSIDKPFDRIATLPYQCSLCRVNFVTPTVAAAVVRSLFNVCS